MPTNQNLENLNFGDTVKLKPNSPLQYNLDNTGSICGIRTINTLELALKYDVELNSCLYLVEFSSGKSIEIPEKFLIKNILINKKLAIPTFDFADSGYDSFIMSEDETLTIFMRTWQEIPFKIIFTNVVQFSYKLGDFSKDFYEVLDDSLFLNEALSLNYIKPLLNHPYKHFQLEDIDDFAFIEVVAESVKILKRSSDDSNWMLITPP